MPVKVIFIFSHAILALGNWLLLATVAKSYTLTEAGDYNLVLACLTPIFLFCSFHLKNYFLAKEGSEKNFSNFVLNRSLGVLISLFSAIVVASYMGVVNQFFWGVFLLKSSEVFFELPFMFEHKSDRLGRTSFLHILRSLLVYGTLIYLLAGEAGVLYSFSVASLASYIGTAIYLWKLKNISWSFSYLEVFRLFKSTFWLGGSASLLSLNVSLPRIFLAYTMGKEAIAIYSVSFAFYSIWQLFFNSYLNAILPKFSQTGLKDKVIFPLAIFLVGSCGFYFFDGEIYSFVFGNEYLAASELTPGLLCSVFLSFFSSYFFYDFMSKGDFEVHFKLNLAALGAHAIVLYPMILMYGLKACYYSWIAALIVQCGLYWSKRPIS